MASIYGGASGNGWKLRLDYTVTQDRAANTSSLRLRLYLYANTTGSYNLEKDSAYYVLQGQKVYQTYQYTAPGWYLLGERTVTVRHGADGNGSVQLGGQWVSDVESSWTPASLSVSAAVALPRILRPSVLRAAELTLGQACVLSIRAEEERYTHRVTYALGGASGTVVQETAQRELTWTPPLELARQLPRSVAGTMRLTVTTYDGDTTMGSSVTECRVYVPDTVRPTAALTVTPVNDNAVLEQWGVFVKGMTRLRWQVTAQGAYGSSIDGCSVSCGGVGGSGLSGVSAGAVSVSGEVTAAAVVKDSRDRFLLAAGTAYGAGTTGGEAVHTLAESELPIHAHDPANQAGYYGFITNSQKAFTVGDMGVQSGSGRYYPYAPAAFDINRNTKTGSVGGGKAHNNMPPYLAVYVWQRTA